MTADQDWLISLKSLINTSNQNPNRLVYVLRYQQNNPIPITRDFSSLFHSPNTSHLHSFIRLHFLFALSIFRVRRTTNKLRNITWELSCFRIFPLIFPKRLSHSTTGKHIFTEVYLCVLKRKVGTIKYQLPIRSNYNKLNKSESKMKRKR